MEISRNLLEHVIVLTTFLTPMAYTEPGIIFHMGLPPPCGYLFVVGWYAPVYFSPLSLIWWPDLVIYSTVAGSWLLLGLFLVMNLHRISNGEPYSFFTKVNLIIALVLQILFPLILLQFIWSYVYIIPLPIPSTIAIIGFVYYNKKKV